MGPKAGPRGLLVPTGGLGAGKQVEGSVVGRRRKGGIHLTNLRERATKDALRKDIFSRPMLN